MTGLTARAAAMVAAVALVSLRVAPAWAQPADPGARAQAAAHTRQGQAYFGRGDYDRAIAEYQAAFDLSNEPSLLFNVGLCYDRTDRAEQALQAFQRYLELAPGGSVAEEARNDVARLVPVVEKIRAERAVAEARRRDDEARRQAEARAAAERDERSAARRTTISRVFLIGGAAFAVAGGVTHLLAWRTRNQLADDRLADDYFRDHDAFLGQRKFAIAGYAVGAAALATGAIFALTVHRPSEAPRVSAAIVPGGAAMVVAWTR
jgi:tetratricopeptide (TPR) repeat protein